MKYSLILFLLASCQAISDLPKAKKIEPLIPGDKAYGEYYFPENEISLDLIPPNDYVLEKLSFFSDIINSKLISEGTFKLRNDTVILSEAATQRSMQLYWINEEKLIAIRVDSVKSGQLFLIWNKLYPNGEVKFSGGWQKGEKDGVWQYFDQKGELTNMKLYEKGIIKDNNFKFKD